ncbi:MAG: glutamyl-tRNA reductase [Proteobacteria bacterium]|nr:glutamyl-tRNA reductase [Pseudomonadota bacterium]MBU1388003.1 glutamyl-tRNA reductase [Pseudomonadota bacterium]MBU1542066.1 glutamyl-tRNA reductase [Pseudomonadota bacterium]MBU2430632.1 glutamyl-tRNA reductase [Pseudomonadota bacterium]MBU2482850.1 glutamyl-tRNA reductase [Pseudomonadota bacterium]
MSKILLIGANHKTAPVELREKLSFTTEETMAALESLRKDPNIGECLVFSTCNRTEVLYVPKTGDQVDRVIEFISSFKKIDVSEFKDHLYIHEEDAAIHHLFCVASSLDSMIVGEPQILGQVKAAYRAAVSSKTTGVLLNRLMHKAYSVAKKVRKETGIGDNAVSISYAAIELANKIFSDLSQKSVMLLGAGEMAELAVEHLLSHRVKKIIVANRTFKKAVELSDKFKGQAVKFEEREDALAEVDIIISSTGATEYVLTCDQVKRAMKKRRHNTLFFIDIAVPRDIDPKINSISNAYVYDIDDLKNIVESNIKQRGKETVKAQRFIEEAVVKFRQWMESLSVVPTIKALNDKMTAIVDMECKKTLSSLKHLSAEDIEAITRMTQAIASRTIHDPILFLRNTGDHRNDSLYLNVTRQLFNLDIPEEK